MVSKGRIYTGFIFTRGATLSRTFEKLAKIGEARTFIRSGYHVVKIILFC